MKTALRLFAERDYSAVTMQDIARACRANHSLIYYYFRNKKALFNAAIEHLIATTIAHYEQVAAKHPGDPVALLDDWIDTNIKLQSELRMLVKVLFDYAGPRRRSVSVDKAIKRFYDYDRRVIARTIRQGVDLGLFERVDVDRVTSFISSQIDGIFFGAMMRANDNLVRKMEELRHFMWVLLGYSARRKRAVGRRANPRRRSAA
ncbi:MAG: TetR/AcrR family transcriptional regulator [Dongiaceae bacterium]